MADPDASQGDTQIADPDAKGDTVRKSSRLQAKRTRDAQGDNAATSSSKCTPEEKRQTNATRQQKIRDNRKANPEEYKAFKASEAERHKVYRANRSEERIQRDRETARLRQQKRRERLKAEGISPSDKAKTRKMSIENKEKNRVRMQNYRANMTEEQKEAEREKRRIHKRHEVPMEMEEPMEIEEPQSEDLPTTPTKDEDVALVLESYNTNSAKLKAVTRVEAMLPKKKGKCVSVLQELNKRAFKSPIKQAIMRREGLLPAEEQKQLQDQASCFGEVLDATKKNRNTGDRQKRADIVGPIVKRLGKHGNRVKLQRKLGITWKYLVKCSLLETEEVSARKKRSDCLSENTVDAVTEFFNRGDISKVDPTAKAVSTKTLKPKRYLESSLQAAHQQFLEQHPDINISF